MLAAACQVSPHVGFPDDTAPVESAVRRAAAAGAGLVVLPELAVTGWSFTTMTPTRALAEKTSGPVVTSLRALSVELGVVIVCGVAERDGDRWWNSAVVVQRGEVAGCYRKAHLWDEEKMWFEAAVSPPLVLDTDIGRLAVMICYDLEFPEWVRLAAESGADVVAVPANWPRNAPRGQLPIEVAKAQAAAAAYGVHVVVADRCGVERGTDWEGASLICGPDGYLLAGPATTPGRTARPALLLAELDLPRARDKARGRHNDVLADRRPELYVQASTPRVGQRRSATSRDERAAGPGR